MDPFEVTNEDYLAFVTANTQWQRDSIPGASHNGHYLEHWVAGRPPAGKGRHPVVFITWNAAQAFCRWAGGRLPTEAEWEYAARGGAAAEFPWGDNLPDASRANYEATGLDGTSAVGRFPPNSFGLHDLAGNVWEFLLDAWEPAYAADAAHDPIAGGPVADESITAVTGRRAVRGGSYEGAILNLRTRWRDSHVANNAVAFVGFRCAYPE
jgi:formylglycine-generating enzyme required for sulfatase activity